MPISAGSVIDQARSRHAAFNKNQHPNKGALQHLSKYVKRLHGQLAQLDPSLVTVNVDTALPLADHDAGITLPTGTRLVESIVGNYATTNSPPRQPYRIRIIDYVQRFAPNAPRGAAWQQGGVLYLRSPASIWQSFESVTITVATVPTDLAELGDTLAVPDSAEETCVEEVAYWLAKRVAQEKDSNIDLGTFKTCATEAHEAFLNDISNNMGNRMFFTEDVWRP